MRYSYNPAYGSSYYTPTTMTPQAGAVRVPGAPSIYPNIDREAMIRAAGEALPYSWQQQQMIDIQRQGQDLARQQMEAERQASRANLWMQGAGLGYKMAGPEGMKKGWNWAMNKPQEWYNRPSGPMPDYPVSYENYQMGAPNSLSTIPSTATGYTPPMSTENMGMTRNYADVNAMYPGGTSKMYNPIPEQAQYAENARRLQMQSAPQSATERMQTIENLRGTEDFNRPYSAGTLQSAGAGNPNLIGRPNFAQRIGGLDYGYGDMAGTALGAYSTGAGVGKLAGMGLRGQPQQTTAEIGGGAVGGALSAGASTGWNPYAMGAGAVLGGVGVKNPLKGRAGQVAQYAGYGATVGSFIPIPGVGTGVGAGVGALAGLIRSFF